MSAEQQSSIVTRHSSILVIQTAFLGDAILTTPLLAALAERHGPVDVVVTPAAAPLLVAHPVIREVIPFDKRGRDRSFRGLWRLGTRLRERRYVRVYLPHRSLRSAILAWLTGAPERIGFADSVAAWSYTRRVARPKAGHEVERLLALVERRKDGKTEGRKERRGSHDSPGPAPISFRPSDFPSIRPSYGTVPRPCTRRCSRSSWMRCRIRSRSSRS